MISMRRIKKIKENKEEECEEEVGIWEERLRGGRDWLEATETQKIENLRNLKKCRKMDKRKPEGKKMGGSGNRGQRRKGIMRINGGCKISL